MLRVVHHRCFSASSSMSSLSSIVRSSLSQSSFCYASSSSSSSPSSSSFAAPLLLSRFVRHGSSSSQSSHAGRATSRSSGSTYRVPKGRENDNSWHIKEPLPTIPTFAPIRHSKEIRQRQTAKAKAARAVEARKKGMTIDFEVAGNEVVTIKGRDGKRPKTSRVKTPLHRALKLAAARKLAASSDGATMDWAADEQSAAEAAALEFVTHYDADAAKAWAATCAEFEREIDEFTPEQRLELTNEFTKQYGPDGEEAQMDRDDAIESHQRDIDAAMAAPAPPKPVFGLPTLLAFLKEYDITINHRRPAASVDGDAKPAPPNPLNQDILVYDVISRFNFADYIVVVKANSARQMRHLAESTYKLARSLGACSSNPKVLSLEGRGREDWMLVDGGHIWVYFFNKTPAVSLPAIGGMYGVNFNVVQTNMKMDASSSANIGNGRPAPPRSQHHQLPFLFNSQHNTIEYTTDVITPAGESQPKMLSAGSINAGASSTAYARPVSLSSSSSSSPSSDIDPSTLPHPTSSPVIASSMWYEPTPDHPNQKKKSAINLMEQRRQLHNDEGGGRGGSNSITGGTSIIDAEFTAMSSSFSSSSHSYSSSSSSSLVDPSLVLLLSSNFTHPVIENLEKNYGDLRVPVRDVMKRKDYLHEDLKNGIKYIDEDVDEEDEQEANTKGKKKRKAKTNKHQSIEIENDAPMTIVTQK